MRHCINIATLVLVVGCAGNSGDIFLRTGDVDGGDIGFGGSSDQAEVDDGGTAGVVDLGADSRLELMTRKRVIDGGGEEVIGTFWYDKKLGIDCMFLPASDGVDRCLPIEYNRVSSQCGVQLAQATCGVIQRYTLQSKAPPAGVCASPSWYVYETGEQVWGDSDCAYSSTGWYSIGDQVDPRIFVGSIVVVE